MFKRVTVNVVYFSTIKKKFLSKEKKKRKFTKYPDFLKTNCRRTE